MAVHLRWYVSNAVFRQALRDGTEPDRVVFLSLHADARHPSTRGLMVYAPGAQHRTKTFGPTAASYQKFREVRESPRVRLTKHQRVRSEAVSRKLGGALAAAFGDAGLPVQPYRPVRAEIIRGKERWVPAVLRGNQVPASVLVELVNLSNRDDAALLADAADRQRMARALVAGLLAYFGERPPAPQAASR
jgi:N-acetylmuramoyl-L-alanine amidase